ncbi:MAG: enolase C-terminal domain-like protein [Nitriliruptoraceae bacterium]
MKIRQIRERTIPLSSQMTNAYMSFSMMTASLVAVESDVIRDGKPVTGYGFTSPGRYGQGEIIRDRAVPRLFAVEPQELVDDNGIIDPLKANKAMLYGEKPGGHGDRSVAIGAVDVALWDLAAKLYDLPLAALFANRFGNGHVAPRTWVYAAGGYYTPNDAVAALEDELSGYLATGFNDVKIKIGGAALALDSERIAAAVKVAGGGAHVAVDANGRFDLPTALAYAEVLSPHNVRWYEEPCDPLDFDTLAQIAAVYPQPLATGENLFSWPDALNLLRYGGLRPAIDVIQIDPALSYGPSEFVSILTQAEALGWSRTQFVPHGGHQLNLALVAGLGLGGTECYPGVFGPIGGFLDDTPVIDGHVAMGAHPGIGVEHKRDLWELLVTL